MYDNNHGLYIAHCADGALAIQGKMANRHGLIAGATGTGKTVTLQVMAMKQGTPAWQKVSAITCKVTVFPVPVAPAIRPCRLAIFP